MDAISVIACLSSRLRFASGGAAAQTRDRSCNSAKRECWDQTATNLIDFLLREQKIIHRDQRCQMKEDDCEVYQPGND